MNPFSVTLRIIINIVSLLTAAFYDLGLLAFVLDGMKGPVERTQRYKGIFRRFISWALGLMYCCPVTNNICTITPCYFNLSEETKKSSKYRGCRKKMPEGQMVRKWLCVKYRENRNNLVQKFTQQASHTGPSRTRFGYLSGKHSQPSMVELTDPSFTDPFCTLVTHQIITSSFIICTNNVWLRDSLH